MPAPAPGTAPETAPAPGTAPLLLRAGAAAIDMSPVDSQFLYGYPHVERMSTGVHDRLFASALLLDDGNSSVMFIGTDAIIAPGDVVERARKRISDVTDIPATNIMITATHTHSAPITQKMVSNVNDPVIPDPDPAYMKLYEEAIIESGIRASANRCSAELALTIADGTGLGTNRHDPQGPAIPRVPVLSVRRCDDQKPVALMMVCNMHPTVMHEDSTLVSGDFPGLTRRYLQEQVVSASCPIVYHMGAAGNQSPRHVTKANTFEEAQRIGEILAKRIEALMPGLNYQSDIALASDRVHFELPPRPLPSVDQAKLGHDAAIQRLKQLRADCAPHAEVRTAECDSFGAEETFALAQCAASGRLQAAIEEVMPAEIQRIVVGPWTFIGWPGEAYVEFAQQIMDHFANTYIITMANNSLHGYVVTQEAVDHHYYEAGNSIFKNPDSGQLIVKHTTELLQQMLPTVN